ncbi:roadblock/LC7 domain-containing protein [Candidatus Micrarchaeota archaeon]|nr:roadblock/LC7 domain-containing protein [Candidatus Micrarchaeota archaeon]
MNRSRAILLAVCLVLLPALFGCFEKVDVIPAEREHIAEMIVGDSDGDGVKDQFVFKFEPVALDENTVLTRMMTVHGVLKPPVYLINLTDIKSINVSAIEQARFELKEFDSAREKLTVQGLGVEKLCRERLGISGFACAGRTQCFAACQNAIECKTLFSSFGEPVLESMEKFQASAKELDDAVEQLDAGLKEVGENGDIETVKIVLDEYGEVQRLAGEHASNLVFDRSFYGVCDQIPFDYSRLKDSRSLFVGAIKVGPNETLTPGVLFIGPSEYEVAVQLKFERKTGEVASEVTVIEEIPREFASEAEQVSFGLNYSEVSTKPPFIVKWVFTNVGGAVKSRSIAYVIHKVPEPEAGWEKFAGEEIERPRIGIRSVTISTIPGYSQAHYAYARQIEAVGFFAALGLISAEVIIAVLWVCAVPRALFLLLKAAKDRKSLKDTLYEWAGHGGQNRLAYAAIGVAALGGAYWILNNNTLPAITADADAIEAITKNTMGMAAAGCVFFGLLSIYFVLSDFVKGFLLGKRYYEKPIPIGVRAVLFESQVVELAKMIEDKIDVLLKRTAEAKKDGFNFQAEEADATEIIKLLSEAEKSVRKGDVAMANAKASEAKLKYQKLVESVVGEKLNKYNELMGRAKDVHSHKEIVDALLREGKAAGARVEDEEKDLQKAGVEQALAKATEAWTVNDFEQSASILDKALESLSAVERDLKDKVGERRKMIERQAKCLECGKSTSITSQNCMHCGANIPATLSRKIIKMKEEVEELKKKMSGERELDGFEYEENTAKELLSAFGKALHAVEAGNYDEATDVIDAEQHRLETLKPAVKDKLESFEGVSKRMENMEDRVKDIRTMFDQAKKFELNMEREEKMYNEIDVDEMVEKIESLFKQDKFGEANEVLTKLEDAYEDLERKMSDKIEEYRNVGDKITLLSREALAASELLSKCKNSGINAEAEERELKSIDVEALRVKSKERKPVSMDIEEASSKIEALKKTLAGKLESAKMFSSRITEVEKKMEEVEKLVAECVSLKIDVSKEQKQASGVDERELKKALENNSADAQKKLNDALEILNSAKVELKQKQAKAQEWGEWSKQITKLLEGKDKVPGNELEGVPPDWREWALEKYASEHFGEALAVDKGALVKLSLQSVSKFQFDLIIQNLVLSGKIEAAAIVRRDGLAIASNLQKGTTTDPETIAALATRMLDKSETASSELGKGRVERIMIGSENGKMIVSTAGKRALLIALTKPKEDVGFMLIALNQASEKIAKLLGN